jgi:hypothetical protein
MPKVIPIAALVLVVAAPHSVSAASTLQACQSQQSLQQIIDSRGALKPEDCRNITVTPVGTGEGRLCALSFSTAGNDILQKLCDAALPDQWWVRCENLGQAGNAP